MKKDLEKNKLNKIEPIYKISDLMDILNVTARTIRYYDSEGLLGSVKRSVGYTRYFNKSDIARIREIKRLKKRGFKIADIKAIFDEKYKQEKNNIQLDFLDLSDVFITEEDISFCQDLGITIINSELCFNKLRTPYLKWLEISEEMFNQPYEIKSRQSKSKKEVSLTINQTNSWEGNSYRGIVNFIKKNKQNPDCSKEKIMNSLSRVSEWLILPVEVVSTLKYDDVKAPIFMLYNRSQTESTQNIYYIHDIIEKLTKQIKDATAPFSGVMNQLTIHSNQKDPNSIKIVNEIKQLINYKHVLDCEQITPYYQMNAGCKNAIYLSIF